LGDFFEIVDPVYNVCLDVVGASVADGAPIQAFRCKNSDNQLWAPEVLADQVHLLWRNCGSGKCLLAEPSFLATVDFEYEQRQDPFSAYRTRSSTEPRSPQSCIGMQNRGRFRAQIHR